MSIFLTNMNINAVYKCCLSHTLTHSHWCVMPKSYHTSLSVVHL